MISIEFRSSPDELAEVVKVSRFRWWKRNLLRYVSVSALLLLTIVLLYSLDPKNRMLYVALGVWIAFVGTGLKAAFPSKNEATRWLEKYPLMRQSFKVAIDSEAIQSVCDIASSQRKWECFTSYYESTRMIVLEEGEGRLFSIPKRAFSEVAQFKEFRELLKAKFPNAKP